MPDDQAAEIKALADEIYRERVLRARKSTVEQRFRAGADLFEMACDRMRMGIRTQFPSLNDFEVEEKLRERLKRLRLAREDAGRRGVETAGWEPDDGTPTPIAEDAQ